MKSFRFTLLVFLILFYTACLDNADRKNPLDPKSPDFNNEGTVSGRTLSFYAPFTEIPRASVSLEPGTFTATTNESGEFLIRNIPSGQFELVAQKDGFENDSATITVTAGQTTSIDLHLDALPIIRSVSINSRHISRNFPQVDLFFLQAWAEVDDPDGVNDIDFVMLIMPELNFTDTLDIAETPGGFSTIITESQLPVNDIRDVLGRQIILTAHDRPGFVNSSQPKFLARIIEKTPLTDFPNQSEVLNDPTPFLVWKAADLMFDFSYLVEVVRVDFGINTPVWSSGGISKLETSVMVSDSLAAGVYFWTVSVVDEFGNWSRSKEASFRIN